MTGPYNKKSKGHYVAYLFLRYFLYIIYIIIKFWHGNVWTVKLCQPFVSIGGKKLDERTKPSEMRKVGGGEGGVKSQGKEYKFFPLRVVPLNRKK